MTTPKKFNPLSNKFDFYDKPVSKISVVTTWADLILTVADIQTQNLAGTVLLRNDLYLTADTTLDLTGIILNLNGFNIFQGHNVGSDHTQGYKLRISGTGWTITNGALWFNNLGYNEINVNNNLGLELLGNAVTVNDYSSITVRGIFDSITFFNYVGTTVSDNPCIKCSNSNGQWGSIQFANCLNLSMTGHEYPNPFPKIDNSPFVIEIQTTYGTTITYSKYRSYHHQSGDYGKAVKLLTSAMNSNGVYFLSDGTINLLNTNIVTDYDAGTTLGVVGVSISFTTDFITKRKLTTDKTGKFALLANPVTLELEQISVDDLEPITNNLFLFENY